jgi:hypothetical protein
VTIVEPEILNRIRQYRVSILDKPPTANTIQAMDNKAGK